MNLETDIQAASDFCAAVGVLGLECLTGYEAQDCDSYHWHGFQFLLTKLVIKVEVSSIHIDSHVPAFQNILDVA